MAKEINEKTFELNITNELLNLSRSFILYLDFFPLHTIFHLKDRTVFTQFLNQATLFTEGLTQEEESNPATGGYDVSINYILPNSQEGRLMFLQYKAGDGMSYSMNPVSKFFRKTAKDEGRTPKHILFTFNEAAQGTQHSTLRKLANKQNIHSDSVMYVFPRITEKTDFKNKIGKLIYNSSFVPVLEIDRQAADQDPSITIIDGVSHNYRTSYDGLISEINYFFMQFNYDKNIVSDLLPELICIQIERIANSILKQEIFPLELFLDELPNAIKRFIEYELENLIHNDLFNSTIDLYIKKVSDEYNETRSIPAAPSRFTTIIPKEGLEIIVGQEDEFASINYQIF